MEFSTVLVWKSQFQLDLLHDYDDFLQRRHKLLISATDMSLAVALGQAFDDQTVSVVTSDGKVLVGTLKGMDNKANLILNDSHERVFSEDQGVEKHHLGLCVIRGENVTLIGQVDRDIDHQLDLAQTKAKPLKPVKH